MIMKILWIFYDEEKLGNGWVGLFIYFYGEEMGILILSLCFEFMFDLRKNFWLFFMC